MKKFISGLIVGLSMIGGVAYATTLNFVQTPPVSLYVSLAAAGTSARITPCPKDLDGTVLTMTDFGSSPTFTVDPKFKNYEEIVGFTGVTNNGDSTCTLTGLSRDLVSKSPYTTTGTGKQHSAGAIVVFSNNPQMYARFAALENTQTISGTWTFDDNDTFRPRLDADTDTAVSTAFVTLGQLSRQAISGASNASETVKGISELATAIEQASSTSAGSTAALLVTRALYSTSSPIGKGCDGTATVGALCSVIARNDGKIHPNFIATSSTDLYNFGGVITFTNNVIATAKIGIGTTSPYSPLSVATGLFPAVFDTIYATSTASGNATSTFAGNVRVIGNATTTNLFVSNVCTNCATNGYEQVTNTGAGPTTGGTSATVTATCSTGKKVISGGGSDTLTNGTIYINASAPNGTNAWIMTYQTSSANSASANTMTAYAICVNP